MLILPSDMYAEKKPPCVREIIDFPIVFVKNSVDNFLGIE